MGSVIIFVLIPSLERYNQIFTRHLLVFLYCYRRNNELVVSVTSHRLYQERQTLVSMPTNSCATSTVSVSLAVNVLLYSKSFTTAANVDLQIIIT